MNVLIVFATNSGSTLAACNIVAEVLVSFGHSVTTKNPKDTSYEDLLHADAIILASPSWNYGDNEGQPHEDFLTLFKTMEGKILEGKPFAIVGLGDSSYMHFCGANDQLSNFVETIHGKLIVQPLSIDRFYQRKENTELITSWSESLTQFLPKS